MSRYRILVRLIWRLLCNAVSNLKPEFHFWIAVFKEVIIYSKKSKDHRVSSMIIRFLIIRGIKIHELLKIKNNGPYIYYITYVYLCCVIFIIIIIKNLKRKRKTIGLCKFYESSHDTNRITNLLTVGVKLTQWNVDKPETTELTAPTHTWPLTNYNKFMIAIIKFIIKLFQTWYIV